jgi:DNA-binding transcriptional ArsR family regulator
VRRLADVLEAYWARAIEPVWPRIRTVLEADIAYRARRLTVGGPAALFADLSPSVTWRQPYLDVQVPGHDATFNLDGRGLLLVPSAFATGPVVSDREPWLPGVIYPARGIATLWEQAPPAPGGLARLIGDSRAKMLADLAAPRSTTELATRLSLSPATTSHHLAALREAGLVTGRREGRSVLYARTALGDALAGTQHPRG